MGTLGLDEGLERVLTAVWQLEHGVAKWGNLEEMIELVTLPELSREEQKMAVHMRQMLGALEGGVMRLAHRGVLGKPRAELLKCAGVNTAKANVLVSKMSRATL